MALSHGRVLRSSLPSTLKQRAEWPPHAKNTLICMSNIGQSFLSAWPAIEIHASRLLQQWMAMVGDLTSSSPLAPSDDGTESRMNMGLPGCWIYVQAKQSRRVDSLPFKWSMPVARTALQDLGGKSLECDLRFFLLESLDLSALPDVVKKPHGANRLDWPCLWRQGAGSGFSSDFIL